MYCDCIKIPLHIVAGKDASDYDVVGNWTSAEQASVRKRVEIAIALGYSTLLLSLDIPKEINPKRLVFPTPLFPDLDPRPAVRRAGVVLQLWRLNLIDYSEDTAKQSAQKGVYTFSNALSGLLPAQVSLLAVHPTSKGAVDHIASALSPPSAYSPSVISVDPAASPKMAVRFNRGAISTLVQNDMYIELTLAPLFSHTGDIESARRNWIANARQIVHDFNGKNIILSSNAHQANEMRAAADIIHLAKLIGLDPKQAKNALSVNPKNAIMRGMMLRQSHKSTLSKGSTVVHKTEHKRDLSDKEKPQPTKAKKAKK